MTDEQLQTLAKAVEHLAPPASVWLKSMKVFIRVIEEMEREACAKVAENMSPPQSWEKGGNAIAAAIRARSQEATP
jgi:hypothetical protein